MIVAELPTVDLSTGLTGIIAHDSLEYDLFYLLNSLQDDLLCC